VGKITLFVGIFSLIELLLSGRSVALSHVNSRALFKECGLYSLVGILKCNGSTNCNMIIGAKTQSEIQFVLKPDSFHSSPYNGKWIRLRANYQNKKSNELLISEPELIVRSLPDQSSGSVSLIRGEACKS
jgi:hypothetical protein